MAAETGLHLTGRPASEALAGALAYQDHILAQVSRTFALTIPQLPAGLREAVANGYLLCRIADTIEDDPDLGWERKGEFQAQFTAVVAGDGSARDFAREFGASLSPRMPAAEHDLIAHTPEVIAITHSFSPIQRAALLRCVRIMGEGMARFQAKASRDGLADQAAMDRYCYYVAGVVGEMLTSLFCAHMPELEGREEEMMGLAVSFGQGLQMTNILKDLWDDWERGVCWLPREVFARHGFAWERMAPGQTDPAFTSALRELIGVARGHLHDALRYTLMIPAREPGIRDFCLWAIGMAVLTLRRIAGRPDFRNGQEVKISRRAVRRTILLSRFIHRQDGLLELAFRVAAKPLP